MTKLEEIFENRKKELNNGGRKTEIKKQLMEFGLESGTFRYYGIELNDSLFIPKHITDQIDFNERARVMHPIVFLESGVEVKRIINNETTHYKRFLYKEYSVEEIIQKVIAIISNHLSCVMSINDSTKPIGSIIKSYMVEVVEAVKNDGCLYCWFSNEYEFICGCGRKTRKIVGECNASKRSDKKNVVFVKKDN